MKARDVILVTGATGLNGALAVRELSRRGVPVRALVRSRARAAAIARLPGVEVMEGDMADARSLSPALEGVGRALLISTADERMVETQCSFISACKWAGVRHIVKFSGRESNLGFEPARFRFTAMHLEVERRLEHSGLAWTHLRPSQFMQTYLREARSIAAEGVLYSPLEQVRMAPVDAADIAQVAAVILTTPGHEKKIYEMTGPEALGMAEIAQRISLAIDKPVRYAACTAEERRRALEAAGAGDYFLDALDEQLAERLRHPVAELRLETHRRFDVRPTSFLEFARAHAAAFRAPAG